MSTMLAPKFRRAHTPAFGRPSPRAVDLTPEQRQQLADAGNQVIGAVVDTVKAGFQPPTPPPAATPTEKSSTPLVVFALVVVGGIYLLRRK